jgi:hypothetical protein
MGRQQITIDRFSGITPRFGAGIAAGGATAAENCDLSSGRIRPLKKARLIESRSGTGNSLYCHDRLWVSGDDRYDLSWKLGHHHLLIFLANGVPRKMVNGITADLGQPRPSPPSVESLTVRIDLADTGSYAWHSSSALSGAYCVTAAGGSDPELQAPDNVLVDGVAFQQESYEDLAPGQWRYADEDGLGFSTVYLRMPEDAAPLDAASTIVHETAPGNVTGKVRYILTTTRDVGGHIDVSGPSGPSEELSVENAKVRVERPLPADAAIVRWTLYRLSDASGAYQFVAEIPVSTEFYEDNLADADLSGGAPATWYTSDQDNEIVFEPPRRDLDGLASEPYGSMLFGWKGAVLYWSEPGSPDAWPEYYFMYFPSSIRRVIPYGGSLGVLLDTGPHRVDGTHPELLQPSRISGREPCVSTAACATSQGIVYLSDSGIVLFDLTKTRVISDSAFTESWFRENVDPAGAVLVENDGLLHCFHSRGQLVLDARGDRAFWTTRTQAASAACRRAEDGALYFLDETGIHRAEAGEGLLTWRWKSGWIGAELRREKLFREVEVFGYGDVGLSLFLDDLFHASRTLDLQSRAGRRLRVRAPGLASSLRFELSGTGEVDAVEVRYSI